jgi:tetratricopeptide (TPR) repeat protein
MADKAGFKEARTHLFDLIKNRGFISTKGKKFFKSQLLTKAVTNETITETVEQCLAGVSKINPRLAEILEKRFKQGETIRQLASAYHLSVDQINRLQRDGLDAVTEIFLDKEAALREQRLEKLIENIPPPNYTKLFGVDSLQARLIQLLNNKEEPWVILVTGIGGIGKTALVNSAVRGLSPSIHYDKVYWLRSSWSRDLRNENQLHSALFSELAPGEVPSSSLIKKLKQFLKTSPSLIILDNLEGELDDQWVTDLRSLANPSRIVVISRQAPRRTTDFYLLRVNEIDQETAFELINYQAHQTGLSEVFDDQLSSKIYDSAGGNALALKIIVGILHSFALKDALLGLKNRNDSRTSTLFDFIFEVAMKALTEPSRLVLDAFLFAGTAGTTLEHISAITGQHAFEDMELIEDLIHRSLVEVSGSVEVKRYGIHRLTETYLTSRGLSASQEISRLNLNYWLNQVMSLGHNLVKDETNNLHRGIELGVSLRQLDDCVKLLSRIQPGILSNYLSTFWLPIFARVANDEKLPPESRCLMLDNLGGLYWQVGQNKTAIDTFEKAEQIAASLNKADQQITALLGVALNHWSTGNYSHANRALKRARSLSRKSTLNDSSAGRLLIVHALVLYSRGKFPSADSKLSKARRYFIDKPKVLSQILIQRGLCYQLQHKYHLALKQYRKAEEVLALISNRTKESAQIEILRSSAFYHMGDTRNAEAALNRARLLNQGFGNDLATQAFLESSLGRVYLSLGKKRIAKKMFQSAKMLWKKIDHPEIRMDITGFLAE